MSKPKKSNAKKSSSRPQRRPVARRRSRWADSVRSVALGVINACAQAYALALLAHIVARR